MLGLILGRRLPMTAGELRIPGLDRPVTIRRDGHGIPMIQAETDGDAAFAVGFCQGQDRAFQLETLLRIGRGTLAELVGPAGLPVDRMSRRIGFHRAAIAQLAVMDADVRAVLDRFALGVIAGQTRGLPRKPHEFVFLGGKPTAWTAADVLAYLKLSTFSLPSNWDVELARLQMIRADGIAAMQAVDPTSHSFQVTSEANQSPNNHLAALAEDIAIFQQYAPRGGGSNNWLLAGSRTVSGKPLLANDPHLAANVPPPWYLVQVRTPNWSVAGATFTGAPAVIIGHNDQAAWGVTAGLTDNTDLFLETIGPDGRSVRAADGSFTTCEVIVERIHVKGKADHVEEILVTPRGPIITPLVPGLSEAVSLRAVWLDPLPVRGFFDVHKAASFEGFRQSFASWPGMPLNVLYADSTGETGWQLIGQLPERTAGFGTVPLPADAPGVGWKPDLLPFSSMPSILNPTTGYIATANEHPPTNEGSPFLGVDFIDPFRADTIRDELAKRTDWDVSACLTLQMSTRSMPWQQMRELVLSMPTTTPEATEAIELLRAWDGNVTSDSPAAAVFEFFQAEMVTRLMRAKLPRSWRFALGGGGKGSGLLGNNLFGDRRAAHLIALMRTQPVGWFDRPWPVEMADALTTVIRHLRKRYGPAPSWWPWGHLRTLHLRHTLLGKSRLLGSLFNLGPIPCGGDSNTINQAGVSLLAPTTPTHNLPNLRAVFDTANWSNSRVVLLGGQSGNPCSPHHADLFPLWQRGEAVPLPWTPEDVLGSSMSTLRLEPT